MRNTTVRLRRTGGWLLLAIGTLFSTVAHAGPGVWTSGWPSGWSVGALAVDPATPSTVYAAASSAVFKSTDAGSTWYGLDTGIYQGYYGFTVNALAISPSAPSTLYLSTDDGIHRSTDSGRTWAVANAGPPNLGLVVALAIDPVKPTTLYAGTGNGWVFKSTDAGGTWTASSTGLANPSNLCCFSTLAINPSTSSTLYTATAGGVFKSTDAGGTWAAASTGLSNHIVSALAIDPSNPSTLYAGTGAGVFRSTDSGGTWSAAGLTSLDVRALAINTANPTTLYAGTNNGVFKSTDSGGTWGDVNGGLPSLFVSALALDPAGSTTLYAGLSDGGVWQTTAPIAGATSILPASAHSPGANGAFYTTDVAIANEGVLPASFVLKFLGNNQDGSNGPEYAFGLDPGESRTFLDVLDSVFHETSNFGAVRIASSSSALNVVSVTSTRGFGGTFGQTIPAVWTSDLIPAGSSRSILYVREDGDFRSNLVLASNAAVVTNVDTALVSPAGSTLATKTYSVPPNGMRQVDRVVRDMGVPNAITGARLVLASSTPEAAFTAFVSVIDEKTNDPTTVVAQPDSVSGSAPFTWLLPSSAHLSGAHGAFYKTNVAIANVGALPASFTLKFLGNDQDGSTGAERTFNLDAGMSVTYFDVLGSVFGETSNFGALRITSDVPTLNIVSVTSTPGFDGTFGQTVPAVPSSDLIRAGASRAILFIREGDGFRSNLVLASDAPDATSVLATLVSPVGEILAKKNYRVPKKGMKQVNRVVRDMGVSEAVTGARLVLSSSTLRAAFTAFASVIDETTNDPTTVEAK